MKLIEWNDNYSVNVEEIDNQHKEIIKIINELYVSIVEGKSRNSVDKIFKDLTEYATTHFKTEEDYFEKINYPEASFHKEQHEDIAKKIEEFKKRNEAGRKILDSEILRFLMSWFINHVILIDKRFTEYFNENGHK
jgi:hemerythrin-like metal-binding protein